MRSVAAIKSHPIHPMLVSFPIGLFIAGFVFDLIGVATLEPRFWMIGWYMIIAGLIGGFAAAVPGVIDLFGVVPPQSSGRKRGYLHGALNGCVLLLFIAIAVYRGDSTTQPD